MRLEAKNGYFRAGLCCFVKIHFALDPISQLIINQQNNQ